MSLLEPRENLFSLEQELQVGQMIDIIPAVLGYSGLVGAVLIVCAWSFEAFESVERHRGLSDLKFAVMYIVAMSLLIVHSAAIEDTTFMFLNSAILTIIAFELLYTIYLHKTGRLKRRSLDAGRKRR